MTELIDHRTARLSLGDHPLSPGGPLLDLALELIDHPTGHLDLALELIDHPTARLGLLLELIDHPTARLGLGDQMLGLGDHLLGPGGSLIHELLERCDVLLSCAIA